MTHKQRLFCFVAHGPIIWTQVLERERLRRLAKAAQVDGMVGE